MYSASLFLFAFIWSKSLTNISLPSLQYPSIGGWTLSDPFPPMAANPTARKHFAANCVELIKNYNFDGIE